jgi:uracil phosphoribosyltransferase
MEHALLELFPEASVYHIGLFREKVSLQAVEYYSRLPAQVTADMLFILDPLIATGGTAIAAVGHIVLSILVFRSLSSPSFSLRSP